MFIYDLTESFKSDSLIVISVWQIESRLLSVLHRSLIIIFLISDEDEGEQLAVCGRSGAGRD